MKNIFVILLVILLPSILWAQLEIPENNNENIFRYEGFTLKYSEEFEQAEWVAYRLQASQTEGTISRTDDFREDPRIETGTASLEDYRGSGFDRGHMAPAADMSWSEKAMSDSFYMSNMSPQRPWFNRIAWRQLEALIRSWAAEYKEIYIATGPVLEDGPYETIGANEVAIPRYYYKVVLDFTQPSVKAIGFVLPNRQIERPLSDFSVSVDFVEAITGIDFFHELDDEIEDLLESEYDFQSW